MPAGRSQYRDLFQTTIDPNAFSQARIALAGIKGAVDKAAVAAVNKTLPKAKTRAVKGLTAYYTIKAAAVRRRILIRKATGTTPQGSVKIMGRPVTQASFKVTDTHTHGVDVQFKKAGPVYSEGDTFLAAVAKD